MNDQLYPTTTEANHHGRRVRRLAAVIVASIALGSGAVAVPHVGAASPAVAPTVSRLEDPASDLAYEAVALLGKGMAGRGRAMDRYVVVRNQLANLIADRLMVPRRDLKQAWREADLDHQRALMAALSQLGVPYRSMQSIEGVAFDCSGLTYYAWGVAGHALPRSSTTQIQAAESRTYDSAQAGDLVQYPGHVMMYLGVGDAIVHSPYPSKWVEVRHLGDRSVRLGDPTL